MSEDPQCSRSGSVWGRQLPWAPRRHGFTGECPGFVCQACKDGGREWCALLGGRLMFQQQVACAPGLPAPSCPGVSRDGEPHYDPCAPSAFGVPYAPPPGSSRCRGYRLTDCLKWALISGNVPLRIFSFKCAMIQFCSAISSLLKEI